MSSSSAAALIKPVVIKAKKVNTLATVRGALVWAKPFMIAIIYAIAMYHLARLFALRRRALAQYIPKKKKKKKKEFVSSSSCLSFFTSHFFKMQRAFQQ